nr:RNA-directed DNA polymerase, eukaryota [Tanacetum cinerariifolium]
MYNLTNIRWVPEFVEDSDDDDESDNGFKDGDAKVQDGGNYGDDSNKWDSEVVIMGDFNEVRFKSERFGSVFNVQGANVFNAFIANAGLEEIIVLFYSGNLNTIMGRFLFDFLIIESEDIVNKRLKVLNSIQHLDKIKGMHVAQKAKIKWAIEGDENTRFDIDMNFPKSITIDQQMDLECAVSKEELKRAVWECGTNKSPGPDGFSFDIPNGCNLCFIALIPKVPDANLVKDFIPISLEVDFEKAYDSVRWDFLDDVLKKFGFGNNWCAWIQSCLRSSRGSIIISGSPTEEFQFFKGLKQDDPLSSFLFILIMESLHLSFQRVMDVGMFNGINLSPLVNLSHMFYADDAVFVRQWCNGNINTLVYVLECFFQASGLRINVCKSKIMGVNVGDKKVKSAASKLESLILNTLFSYLRTKVGGNMSRVEAWTEVVDKSPLDCVTFVRVHSLSFFNGHELNSNKASWVKWKSVLASKEKGGLGVLSLYALNRAHMMKWVWRFYSKKESLWARVIKAIYGDDGQSLIICGLNWVTDNLRPFGMIIGLVVGKFSSWVWSLEGSGEFSVASIRKIIDDNRLSTVDTWTIWIKYVPIKVNVLA